MSHRDEEDQKQKEWEDKIGIFQVIMLALIAAFLGYYLTDVAIKVSIPKTEFSN